MKENQEQPQQERYLTVGQVAKRLGLSRRSVHNRIFDGNLYAIQLPGMSRYSIPESSLTLYINSARNVYSGVAEKVANLPDL